MEKFLLGIDLGGTNTKLGLVKQGHGLVEHLSVATRVEEGPEAATRQWMNAVKPWFQKYNIIGIGIGSPGPLDRQKGTLYKSPNLPGWEGFSFTEALQKQTGKPTLLDKDATVSALGEWKYGEGKGLTDLIVVTLGTGIGTGVISGNQILRGSAGYAPEIGHMVVDLNGPVCKCGRRGCLEAFTGAVATSLRYDELRGQTENASIAEIFARARAGELAANTVIHQWIRALAVALGNMVNVFNPQKIILTGGVAQSWTFVEAEIQKILLHEAFEPSLKCVEIVQSKLGNDGALLGAASLAESQLT